MKKNLLFISCEEAYHICDKAQYNEASFWEKIKLKLRYAWCNLTRAYVKRNKKLTIIIKNSNVNCLNNVERQHLKEQFEKQLKYQN